MTAYTEQRPPEQHPTALREGDDGDPGQLHVHPYTDAPSFTATFASSGGCPFDGQVRTTPFTVDVIS